MKTTILGVDPGSRITGFGVIETDGERLIHVRHGVILLEEDASFGARLGQLAISIRELLEKHRPQHVVLEKIFLGKNADSAFKLGHARGVLMSEAALAGAEISEYAARQVKKGVTGSGGASKEDVQAVVQNLLAVPHIQRIDASDALALACYHVFEFRKARLLRRAVEGVRL
ncbi:MAG TPA: crossover junction endodeoxyribonuclease RuvC [Pseudobdellovibrionaceae bacterium]|nr:crossover junction endodeoxyribonuclease RuvC [Pseudobdellovibrionaceae bacterium]